MGEKWNNFNNSLAEYIFYGAGTITLLTIAVLFLSLIIAGGIIFFKQIKEFFEYL